MHPGRSIEPADPQGPVALSLLREAAIEARALYPDPGTENAPWPGNPRTPPRGIYLVACVGGSPVASGALRPIDEHTVEIRRMFVLSRARRQGHASALLVALEHYAAQYGFTLMRLETGNRQSAAMALYESCGFRRIAAYGEHESDPTSVCYEKHVVAPRPLATRGRRVGQLIHNEFMAASHMIQRATGMAGAPGREWVVQWLSAVAEGRSTMSQRKWSSIEKHAGGIELVKAVAVELEVHLVQLADDKGNLLVAASRHEFKVIA